MNRSTETTLRSLAPDLTRRINRTLRYFLLGTLVSVSGAPFLSAQATPTGTPLSALRQMLAATGWSTATDPADILAGGKLTQYSGTTSATTDFVIKQKGLTMSRIEVQGGDLVILTDGDQASRVRRDGTRVSPFNVAISMRPFTFPFYSDLTNFTDAAITLSGPVNELVAGQAAQRIDIIRAPAAGDPGAAARQVVGHLSVWLSPSTHLPVQIRFTRVSADGSPAAVEHTLTLAKYQTVGGVLIPFHQEEYLGTELISVLDLNNVQTNVGLADANFVFLGMK